MSTPNLTLSPWILSRREDLPFFIGSCLLGYLLAALAIASNGLPAIVFFQISFLLDGPHVYSTATRVLFDGDERRRLRLWFLLLIPLCAIGPALLAVGVNPAKLFLLVMCWGQYHIAKQHMGFVMIYKRKAQERHSFKADRHFTLISLLLPFAYYLSVVVFGRSFILAFLLPALGLAIYYFWTQRFSATPKLILLAMTIPLHWLIWPYAAQEPHSFPRLLAAAAVTTAGHSVQYLRLMWLHNSNRYGSRGGVLGLISKHWAFFMLAALVLSAPQYLPSVFKSSQIAGAAAFGFLMLHYVLDSKIWRIRGDAELSSALRL